jgi:predicted ATPase
MRRAIDSGHIPTLANTYLFKSLLETIRDDAEATLRDAEALVEIAGKHRLALYLATGSLVRGWAKARLGDREAGVTELRHALAKSDEQGNRSSVPLFEGLLAGLVGKGESLAEAVTRIEGALSVAQQTGQHCTDAFLQRIRGDLLLKANLGNPARAEEAYLVAIGIAQQQGARSFGLLAALSLARLYQSTGRPADAHAILAPALEDFAPTPEMPEIAEAQALLAAIEANAPVRPE